MHCTPVYCTIVQMCVPVLVESLALAVTPTNPRGQVRYKGYSDTHRK